MWHFQLVVAWYMCFGTNVWPHSLVLITLNPHSAVIDQNISFIKTAANQAAENDQINHFGGSLNSVSDKGTCVMTFKYQECKNQLQEFDRSKSKRSLMNWLIHGLWIIRSEICRKRSFVNEDKTTFKISSNSISFYIFTSREKKKGMCAVRESNPGRKNGNLPWYRYTNGAPWMPMKHPKLFNPCLIDSKIICNMEHWSNARLNCDVLLSVDETQILGIFNPPVTKSRTLRTFFSPDISDMNLWKKKKKNNNNV